MKKNKHTKLNWTLQLQFGTLCIIYYVHRKKKQIVSAKILSGLCVIWVDDRIWVNTHWLTKYRREEKRKKISQLFSDLVAFTSEKSI